METIHTQGISTAILCDCMDYMRGLPDTAFELAIVDPPYGIGQPKQGNLKGYKGRPSLVERLERNRLKNGGSKLEGRVLNTNNCEWDNVIPPKAYFDELRRVSRNQIIWGGNYFDLPPSRCVICWDKCQPWRNFSQWEMAWTSFDKPAPLFKFDNRTGGKIHPTQKPVELYAWLLKRFAKPGDRILDTHLGSGSSRIAAYHLSFEFVGIEIDPDYFAEQNARFEHECLGITITKNGSKFIQQKLAL